MLEGAMIVVAEGALTVGYPELVLKGAWKADGAGVRVGLGGMGARTRMVRSAKDLVLSASYDGERFQSLMGWGK